MLLDACVSSHFFAVYPTMHAEVARVKQPQTAAAKLYRMAAQSVLNHGCQLALKNTIRVVQYNLSWLYGSRVVEGHIVTQKSFKREKNVIWQLELDRRRQWLRTGHNFLSLRIIRRRPASTQTWNQPRSERVLEPKPRLETDLFSSAYIISSFRARKQVLTVFVYFAT